MPDSGPSMNPFQVIQKSFKGIRSIGELLAVRSQLLWQSTAVYLVLSIGLLLLVFATSFPYYEDSGFLATVPALPVMLFAGSWLGSMLLQAVVNRKLFEAAHSAFAAGHVSLVMSLSLALVVLTFHFTWGSTASLVTLAIVLLGGISWTALQLHHHWTQLLDIPGGWATFLSGFFVAGIQAGSLYLWLNYLSNDFLAWNAMQFLD